MNGRRLVAALLAAVLLAWTGGVAAESGSATPSGPILARAYPVRFHPLADAAEVVSSVLSRDGSLTLKPKLKMLVVQDHASVLERVASLLQSFDLPPRNVEVTLALFLGTDRRDEEAGRQAPPPGPPSREVRGVTETLADVTKWNAYESLGSRSVVGTEGAVVTADLSDDYRVVFEVESVTEKPDTIKFRSVRLERIRRGPDGSVQVQNLLTTANTLEAGKMWIVGAAQSPESKKALFLSLQAKPR